MDLQIQHNVSPKFKEITQFCQTLRFFLEEKLFIKVMVHVHRRYLTQCSMFVLYDMLEDWFLKLDRTYS